MITKELQFDIRKVNYIQIRFTNINMAQVAVKVITVLNNNHTKLLHIIGSKSRTTNPKFLEEANILIA